jgi:hypothetical protein
VADLQCRPADVEHPGEDDVEGVLSPDGLTSESAEERNEAGEDQYQPADVPRLALADPRVGLIRKHPDERRGNAVADLPGEHGAGRCIRRHDLLQEVEKVVEPTRSHQVVDEVPHSVGPELLLPQTIVAVLREGGQVRGCLDLLQIEEVVLLDGLHII